MNVVLVIPTYNERENIQILLDALRVAAKSVSHTMTYLIVDDTSPDGTAQVVREYAKKYTNVKIIVGKKEGLGKAILRGMKYAVNELTADVVMQMDADLSHDPTKLPLFLEKIDKGYDFVVGSRYIPGGSIPSNWGLHRKIFSIVANLFVRIGLGFPSVHDWTGGYRAYRKKYVTELEDQMGQYSGYVFQIAFLHKSIKLGARVGEVPFHFTDRQYGISKIYAAEYIKHVIRYVVIQRWDWFVHGSFGKFCVVGSVGFTINTLLLLLGVRMGAHPSISAAIGAECAIISNFMLNNAWTFRKRKISGTKKILKFLQFNATSVGAIVIQSSTIWIGTKFFGLSVYFLFYIFGVGIGLIWNYLMYSRVIWKKQS